MLHLPGEHIAICILFLPVAGCSVLSPSLFMTYRCQMFLGGSITWDNAPNWTIQGIRVPYF